MWRSKRGEATPGVFRGSSGAWGSFQGSFRVLGCFSLTGPFSAFGGLGFKVQGLGGFRSLRGVLVLWQRAPS